MAIDRKKLAEFAGFPEDKLAENDDVEDSELNTRYDSLLPLLEESAHYLIDLCDEMNIDVLEDTSAALGDDDLEILDEGFESFPDELRSEIKRSLAAVPHDAALKLAEHLESEELIDSDDVDRVAGLLFHLGSFFEENSENVDKEDDAEPDLDEFSTADELEEL